MDRETLITSLARRISAHPHLAPDLKKKLINALKLISEDWLQKIEDFMDKYDKKFLEHYESLIHALRESITQNF